MIGTLGRRSFGDGIFVSVLGVGCSRVGSISNPVPMREIEATLEAAVEAGVNLFDTADIYGQGDSERTLARLLRRHRDRMFVVTKVGGRHGRYAGVVRLAKPLLRVLARSRPTLRGAVVAARTATVAHEFSSVDLHQAVEASRRRLGLDQLHGLAANFVGGRGFRRRMTAPLHRGQCQASLWLMLSQKGKKKQAIIILKANLIMLKYYASSAKFNLYGAKRSGRLEDFGAATTRAFVELTLSIIPNRA
jgi:hypothetical protein